MKKIQTISGYPDPTATPVDYRVDLLYKFTTNSCMSNHPDWDCIQVQLKLPNDKNIFWYLYTKR